MKRMVGFVANPARVLRLRWFNAIGCDDPSQARLRAFECKMYAIFSAMEICASVSKMWA